MRIPFLFSLPRLADPWIDGRLSRTFQEYGRLSARQLKMPKLLLLGNVMMHGTAQDAATFTASLRRQFRL